MALKVYADRMSQPSRAVILFCKVNGIDFEEILVDIFKNQQFSPEYKAINPMHQVPAIVDGRFKLFERYPGDLIKRAKIHSVLDWHHANLRRGSAGLVFNTLLAQLDGHQSYPQVVNQAEGILLKSLSMLEKFWLKDGRFLVGGSQPSIADISLVCEIMQLELLSEKERDRILGPFKKVVQWIEDTKIATAPHFDEVHGVLFNAQKRFRERMKTKPELKAKL
ncbi:hypothetical protein M8C21_022318 [Ambrosia artemisiifolia]|uniref:glutathione transferase n=1 Tax=Ambrosia artemisiifolia TaxID=4212 RepID=A0AAD5D996_AMBAR|nr:hypothetical protein M8C21_022318 [Ambrosia artemisiifolia]